MFYQLELGWDKMQMEGAMLKLNLAKYTAWTVSICAAVAYLVVV
jgi:hypothetical protein